MTKLLCTTAALGLLIAAPAFADQITAGPSKQSIAFSGSAAAGFAVTAPQLDLPAFDTTNVGLGGAWILGLDLTTGPESNGFFAPASNSETFIYTAADGGGTPNPTPGGDHLVETIHITQIQDDTTQPKFYFTGDAPSVIQGDAAFVAAFSGPDIGDWIMNDIGATLTSLSGTANATISSLEKIPTSSPVPEPATLSLIAAGMFGLAWANRRRIRRNGLG
jgi:PEP-CTERM motif